MRPPRTPLGQKWLVGIGLSLIALFAASGNGHADTELAKERLAEAALTDPLAMGVMRCMVCHDESWDYPVLSIKQTRHAVMADPRTPFGSGGCESCHGDARDHMWPPPDAEPLAEGEKRIKPPVVFKTGYEPPEIQNRPCLGCHESGDRMHWRGSRHDFQNLACVSCHVIHAPQDKVLDRRDQASVCIGCHTDKRAEILKPSRHPIRDGQMACSDCHNPHGAAGPSLLREPTLNETCYTCHAEKRGPFLWEHAPAREDCTICHDVHGSIHPAMLKTRGPWLCQQCHMGTHSAGAFGAGGIGSDVSMAGKSCLNCHAQVHGTNNPAGPRFTH